MLRFANRLKGFSDAPRRGAARRASVAHAREDCAPWRLRRASPANPDPTHTTTPPPSHPRPTHTPPRTHASPTGTARLMLHVGETTIGVPFSRPHAAALDAALQALLKTVRARAGARAPCGPARAGRILPSSHDA